MFNLQRFGQLIRLTIQRSPRWYLFAHLAGCFLITILIYFILGERGRYLENHSQAILHMDTLLYGFIWVNILSLLPVTAHFIGRHYHNLKESTDTLSLPTSKLERFLVLILGACVVIPLIGFVGSILYYIVLKAVAVPFIMPPLKWVLPLLTLTMAPYFLGLPPMFALAFLRPKQTVLWAMGVIAASVLLVLIYIQVFPTDNIVFGLETPENLIPRADVFGPSAEESQTIYLNAMQQFFTGYTKSAILFVVVAVLFFTSAFRALTSKQV